MIQGIGENGKRIKAINQGCKGVFWSHVIASELASERWLFSRSRHQEWSQEQVQVQPRAGGRQAENSHCQILLLPPQNITPRPNSLTKMFLILSTRPEVPPPHNYPLQSQQSSRSDRAVVHLLSCPPPDVVLGSRPPAPPTPAAPGIPGAPNPGGVPLCLSKLPGLEK